MKRDSVKEGEIGRERIREKWKGMNVIARYCPVKQRW